jgi:hypothetical protein
MRFGDKAGHFVGQFFNPIFLGLEFFQYVFEFAQGFMALVINAKNRVYWVFTAAGWANSNVFMKCSIHFVILEP